MNIVCLHQNMPISELLASWHRIQRTRFLDFLDFNALYTAFLLSLLDMKWSHIFFMIIFALIAFKRLNPYVQCTNVYASRVFKFRSRYMFTLFSSCLCYQIQILCIIFYIYVCRDFIHLNCVKISFLFIQWFWTTADITMNSFISSQRIVSFIKADGALKVSSYSLVWTERLLSHGTARFDFRLLRFSACFFQSCIFIDKHE